MHIDLASGSPLLDAKALIVTFGYLGILAAMFAETGLLVGFFLPGDSLLFTAGFFSASSHADVRLSLYAVIPLAAAGAILGGQTGWVIGRRAGPALFSRPDSRLFKKEYVDKADRVVARFGPAKAVVIGRFVPIVRTFVNPMAGVIQMDARTFAFWNLAGGLLWTVSVTLLGYFLGQVAVVKDHLELMILAVVALSLLPIVVGLLRTRREAAARSTR